jgi:nucleotide-binding universal stress UspA family protein
MQKRILVPLDGSYSSERALPYAIETARKFDAEIRLLRVVRPSYPVTPVGPSGTGIVSPHTNELLVKSVREEEAAEATRADRYLRNKTRRIAKLGLACSYAVVLGDPADSIIERCEKDSIDLVVMTTSGKSGLKRAFLGSVADKIIRQPGFPVLVIRNDAGVAHRRGNLAYSLDARIN